MVKVSVVVPTFNRCLIVKQAVQSVLSQTYQDWELIIVDDGSIDQTHAAINAFSDARIKYIHQHNAGLAVARNVGIGVSSGDWVAFLDDDDLWAADKLSRQLEAVSVNPELGLINCGWVNLDKLGKPISQVTPWLWWADLDLKTWLVSCPAVPSGVMVKRSWLQEAMGFDEALSAKACGAEDWDLWLRLSRAGCPMAWVREILCSYRIHTGNMSKNALRQRQSMMLVLDKLFSDPAIEPDLVAEKQFVYSRAYMRGAARLYISGETEAAKKDIKCAVECAPDLLSNQGEEIISLLTGWLSSPIIEHPVDYMRTALENLPEDVDKAVASRKRMAYSLAMKQALQKAQASNDRKMILRTIQVISRIDNKIMMDRSVGQMILKALLRTSPPPFSKQKFGAFS